MPTSVPYIFYVVSINTCCHAFVADILEEMYLNHLRTIHINTFVITKRALETKVRHYADVFRPYDNKVVHTCTL